MFVDVPFVPECYTTWWFLIREGRVHCSQIPLYFFRELLNNTALRSEGLQYLPADMATLDLLTECLQNDTQKLELTSYACTWIENLFYNSNNQGLVEKVAGLFTNVYLAGWNRHIINISQPVIDVLCAMLRQRFAVILQQGKRTLSVSDISFFSAIWVIFSSPDSRVLFENQFQQFAEFNDFLATVESDIEVLTHKEAFEQVLSDWFPNSIDMRRLIRL